MVKFPNLAGEIAAKGRKHYEIAVAAGMDESVFSRCIRGLRAFSHEQRRKIAVFLDCPQCWLFRETRRPHTKSTRNKTCAGRKSHHFRWM